MDFAQNFQTSSASVIWAGLGQIAVSTVAATTIRPAIKDWANVTIAKITLRANIATSAKLDPMEMRPVQLVASPASAIYMKTFPRGTAMPPAVYAIVCTIPKEFIVNFVEVDTMVTLVKVVGATSNVNTEQWFLRLTMAFSARTFATSISISTTESSKKII